MTLQDMVEKYEQQRIEAERLGATAPLALTFAAVLADLRNLDGAVASVRLMNTSEAATVLGIARKTVAAWASQGRFAGAVKTSEAGEWRIPSDVVYAHIRRAPERSATVISRLWRPAYGKTA